MKLIRRLFKTFVFLSLVGGWTLAAASLHVVLTPDASTRQKVIVIPKNELEFRDTFVDTRNWTLVDVSAHPKVVQRLIDTGKSDRLAHVLDAQNNLAASIQLTDALLNPPSTRPAEKPDVMKKAESWLEEMKQKARDTVETSVTPPGRPVEPAPEKTKERSKLFPE